MFDTWIPETTTWFGPSNRYYDIIGYYRNNKKNSLGFEPGKDVWVSQPPLNMMVTSITAKPPMAAEFMWLGQLFILGFHQYLVQYHVLPMSVGTKQQFVWGFLYATAC